jgi:hypothetical protein
MRLGLYRCGLPSPEFTGLEKVIMDGSAFNSKENAIKIRINEKINKFFNITTPNII